MASEHAQARGPAPSYRRIEVDDAAIRHLIAQEWAILSDLPKWQEDMLRAPKRK